MIGPMIAFSISLTRPGLSVMNRALKKLLGSCADEPGEQEADQDLLPYHRPVVAEVVRYV